MTRYAKPFGSLDQLYRAYWSDFDHLLRQQPEDWLRQPTIDSYWTLFRLGRPGVHLAAVILMPTRRPFQKGLRVELSLVKKDLGADAQRFHSRFMAEREGFEASIGAPLDWNSNTDNQYQIGLNQLDFDPAEYGQWGAQHDWLLTWLRQFNVVFGARHS